MTKEEFVRDFELGIEEEFASEIRVGIKMPDLDELEWIHNPYENFAVKLEYYKNAYDDNMRLKAFDQIQIEIIEFFHSEGGFWEEIGDFD